MDNKEELKKIIRLLANKENFKSQLKSMAHSSLIDSHTATIKEQIVDLIRKNDLVDDILSELSLRGQKYFQTKSRSDAVDRPLDATNRVKFGDIINKNRRYLKLNVSSGRAFVNYIQANAEDSTSTLTLHVRFGHQRFKSESVPCCCEPHFDQQFTIDLDNVKSDVNQLLSITHPINIVTVRTCRDKVNIVSTCELDWRNVLSTKDKIVLSQELHGIGPESRMSIGILNLSLSTFPPCDVTLSRETIVTNGKVEKHRADERKREFMDYAKQWWREYLDIRPEHSQRLIKLFAQDLFGEHRFVCSFLTRVAVGRNLGGACEVLRFVSLIPHDGDTLSLVGGAAVKLDLWCDVATFLATGTGDCLSHSLLLCCLLRDCGLNAFVCLGTRSKMEPCSWVLTVGHSGDVAFWDAAAGLRYASVQNKNREHLPNIEQHPYQTIDCIFNDGSLYANCQSSNHIEPCDFDLSDGTRWKAMSSEGIRSLEGDRTPALPMELLPATLNPLCSSLKIEAALRSYVAQHREDMGLFTRWNAELGLILGQCLTKYEMEKITEKSIDKDDFYDAVQNVIPSGHTFKGFPIHTQHLNANKIFTESLKSPIFKEIVSSRGDEIFYSLHVKIYAYPENVVSCWTMIAVSFCQI